MAGAGRNPKAMKKGIVRQPREHLPAFGYLPFKVWPGEARLEKAVKSGGSVE